MSYGKSFRCLASLAALAFLVPAACGGNANQNGTGGGPSGGDGTSCDQAIDITEVVDRDGTYSGQATATGSFDGLCASQKGSIEFLRFDATPGNYEITLSGSHDSADVNAVLDVRTDCTSSASEIGCDPHAVSPPTLVGVEKAGPVFLVLSGDWYGKGYEIRVKRSPKCTADYDCTASYPEALCDTKTGACYAPLACAAGTGDCDADPSDGCETDITKDPANCGNCGVHCKGPNATGGTCAASSCVLACDSGYADCDKDPVNGCETYLLEDGANCGACGKDCVHGGCQASTCGAPPVALGTTSIVSSNSGIAVDATNVYVAGQFDANTGGVLSVPKAGGAAKVLVNDDCDINSLVVDATTVYWAGTDCNTGNSAIKSAPIAGGATTVLMDDTTNTQYPAGLIADATTLYWYDSNQGTIYSMPKTGGGPQILASLQGGQQMLGFAADATTLYFTSGDYCVGTAELPIGAQDGRQPREHRAAPGGVLRAARDLGHGPLRRHRHGHRPHLDHGRLAHQAHQRAPGAGRPLRHADGHLDGDRGREPLLVRGRHQPLRVLPDPGRDLEDPARRRRRRRARERGVPRADRGRRERRLHERDLLGRRGPARGAVAWQPIEIRKKRTARDARDARIQVNLPFPCAPCAPCALAVSLGFLQRAALGSDRVLRTILSPPRFACRARAPRPRRVWGHRQQGRGGGGRALRGRRRVLCPGD